MFLSNPPLDLCQNSSCLEGVEDFFPKFNIIRFVVKEPHLPKVEGVEIVYFFSQSKQSDF
jgi:hypothetical protein